MCKSWRAFIIAVAAVAVLAFPHASAAQVNVIISGGFSAAYGKLLPEFEQSSGITVTTTTGGSQGNGPNTIGNQLRRGIPADVVIMNRAGLNDLIAEGRIVTGSDRDISVWQCAPARRNPTFIPSTHLSRRSCVRHPSHSTAAPPAST